MPSWLSGLRRCTGSSPGVASRATGHCGARASLCGLLLLRSAGSRVRRLQQLWLPASEQRLSSSCGARKLSCFSACASRTRDQTWAPASAGDSATLTPQGSPLWLLLSLVSHHQDCCLPLLTETPSISLGFLTPLPNTSLLSQSTFFNNGVCLSSPKNTRIPQNYILGASSACLMPFPIDFTNFHGFNHHPFIPSSKIS